MQPKFSRRPVTPAANRVAEVVDVSGDGDGDGDGLCNGASRPLGMRIVQWARASLSVGCFFFYFLTLLTDITPVCRLVLATVTAQANPCCRLSAHQPRRVQSAGSSGGGGLPCGSLPFQLLPD